MELEDVDVVGLQAFQDALSDLDDLPPRRFLVHVVIGGRLDLRRHDVFVPPACRARPMTSSLLSLP